MGLTLWPNLVLWVGWRYTTGMTTEAAPIRRRKLSDEVQDRVLAIIQDGSLSPGDLLPSERELMTKYRVGRPAIREAMQNLQRMGLVNIRHGERPRVAEPSVEAMVDQMAESMRHLLTHSKASMDHLKEARTTFESQMAKIAAANRTDDDIKALRDVLENQERNISAPPQFLDWDAEFHRVIASTSHNPIFESLSHALFKWLTQFHVSLVHRPGFEDLTLKEHHGILEAIIAQDAELAGKRMEDHLFRASTLYENINLGS